jgi:hypothetical protein
MSTWVPFAAAHPGAAHIARGQGTSDAHRAAVQADGRVVILVVADGVGARPLAPVAAQLAASIAERALRVADLTGPPQLQRAIVHAAIHAARCTVHAAAAALAVPTRELATTLLVTIVSDQGAVFGGVGDGFLVLRSAPPAVVGSDGDLHLLTLTPPDPIANATPVLAGDGDVTVEVVCDPYLTGALLSTDGLEAPAVDAPVGTLRRPRGRGGPAASRGRSDRRQSAARRVGSAGLGPGFG